jgi:Lrp/AsnC family transcriptional regulator, regulator for asnA, asnC and gidA
MDGDRTQVAAVRQLVERMGYASSGRCPAVTAMPRSPERTLVAMSRRRRETLGPPPGRGAEGTVSTSGAQRAVRAEGYADDPGAQLGFDPVDRRILALLQRNGRMSNSAIARSLAVSEPTIRRRINHLLSTERLRIVAVPSPESAGLTLSAVLGLSCELKELDRIARTLIGFKELRYVVYTTGPYDLMCEGFFYSHQHLLQFLTHQIASINGITRTETSIVLKAAKFSFEWELPFDDDPESAVSIE